MDLPPDTAIFPPAQVGTQMSLLDRFQLAEEILTLAFGVYLHFKMGSILQACRDFGVAIRELIHRLFSGISAVQK